jgi:signal peptidase I
MMRLLWLAFLGALGALLLRLFVMEGIVIASASMEPALPVGRHLLVNKTAYWTVPPKRGDIVVFPSPVDEEKDLVKRIVALPGEEVRIVEKAIHIDGKLLEEPYAVHLREGEKFSDDNMEVGFVPKGRVFVLGDNRDHSGDSRDWKDPKTGEPIHFVSLKDIKGKVIEP